MTIFILTDCLADLTGGAEKQIYQLVENFQHTHTVHIASLTPIGPVPTEKLEKLRCSIHTFNIKRIYSLSGILAGIKFKKTLKVINPDVLITYHFSSDIWGTFWGHCAQVPFIVSNRRDMGFWRNHWHILTYRLINPWVQKIIAVSSSVKEIIIKKEGVSAEKINVIYNGIELPPAYKLEINQEKQNLGLSSNDIIIIHVANLRPIKGHQYLIEAFAQTLTHHPNTKLILIGKDELNGELQALVSKLNISSHILFLGQRRDISKLLLLADICILPSLSEGMSNSILEYMTVGKPVIATRVGGNPELIRDGYNGLLVEKEDVSQLSAAMTQLIQNQDMRERMGNNGLNLVKKDFSIEAMINKYVNLFQIKVLHLVSSGGLFGAEQVMLTLAGCKDGITHIIGAIRNQHNPHIEIAEEAQRRGIKTAIFDSKGRFDFSVIKEVSNFAVSHSINIIHTHNYKANFIGFRAAKRSHKKWMVTAHGWTEVDIKVKLYEALDVFFLKFANQVICVSDTNYQKLLKKKFNPKKLSTISNGINIDTFSQEIERNLIRHDLGLSKEDVVITIIGRLSPEKGHEILLKSLQIVVKEHSHVKCLIVGDGVLKDKLEKSSKELKMSQNIIFTGVRKDMNNIYKACDIFVNSSYTEGLPMTILEAMACRLPIIASSVGAIPNVIKDTFNGILIDPGDSLILSQAILDLIKNPLKRKALAEQAYKDVCLNYTSQKMSQNYQEIYKKLL